MTAKRRPNGGGDAPPADRGPLVERAAAALAAAAQGSAAAPDAAAKAAIGKWLALLEVWNARIDLTAAKTPEQLVDLMLADALVLAPRMPQGARVVDVGTGAGAPGLALALLRPDLKLTLVEPLQKRAAFLRTVLGEVGRADVTIARDRGEAHAGRRAWDAAVSRATLAPQAWLDLGVTLAGPGGVVWVLLAKEAPPTNAHAVVEHDVAYAWPLTHAERRAVGYRVLS
jgi:16S rRNA (guanine527-N7)-methyltransferase